MSKDLEPAKDKEQWPYWVGLGGALMYFVVVYFGYEDRGYAAIVFILSIGVALAASWNSRRHVLFWLTAVGLVAAHIALVLLLPWPTWKLSGAAFMTIAFPDFIANFVIMRLIQMAIKRQVHESSPS